MKVLICGDRNFNSQLLMDAILDKYHFQYGFGTVIEGEARGADSMARNWAEFHEIPVEKYPADWNKYGKGAGPIRNKQMLVEGKPDLVIAFLAPNSKGTANMIKQAKEAQVAVEVINIEDTTLNRPATGF